MQACKRIDVVSGIHTIDNAMNYLKRYCASYIMDCNGATVMVDCGRAATWAKYTSAEIRKAGFDPTYVDYLFLTHEHNDHIGAAGHIAQLNPNVTIFCHPKAAAFLQDVSIPNAEKKTVYESDKQRAAIGYSVPVPGKNIRLVDDNEIIDINGCKFKCYWTPGHRNGCTSYHYLQPDVVFCSDIPGNCFVDCGAHYTLAGNDNNYLKNIESLRRLQRLNASYLALGHYGFTNHVDEVIEESIALHEEVLAGAKQVMEENQNADQAQKIAEYYLAQHQPAIDVFLEVNNDKEGRGRAVYDYAVKEHFPSQARRFALFCQTLYFPELAFKV